MTFIILLVLLMIGLLVKGIGKLGTQYYRDGRVKTKKWIGPSQYWKLEDAGNVISVVACMLGFFALLLWVGFYIPAMSLPAQREAIKDTLYNYRNSGDTTERTAISIRVADFNKELAEKKYWNNNWFTGSFVPDKVAKLDFIK